MVLIDCSLDYFASKIGTLERLKSTYTLSEAVLSAIEMPAPLGGIGGLVHVHLSVKSPVKRQVHKLVVRSAVHTDPS